MLIKSAILSAVGANFDDSIDIEHDIQPSVKILIMYRRRFLLYRLMILMNKNVYKEFNLVCCMC